jgi:hypothetical protein
MDYGRIQELLLDVQHRHSDGSWGTLEPEESHDTSEDDPDRGWSNSTLFRCKTCEEEVRIRPISEPGRPGGQS